MGLIRLDRVERFEPKDAAMASSAISVSHSASSDETQSLDRAGKRTESKA